MKPARVQVDKVLLWSISTTLPLITALLLSLNLPLAGTLPTDASPVTSPIALPLTRDDFGISALGLVEDEWDPLESAELHLVHLNKYCTIDETFDMVVCRGLKTRADLPPNHDEFHRVRTGHFLNISAGGDLRIPDFHGHFPQLVSLTIGQSPGTSHQFLHELLSTGSGTLDNSEDQWDSTKKPFSWASVRRLNLSGNELQSKSFPFSLMKVFPNLVGLDLGRNNITTLANIPRSSLNQLQYIDLSDNPLDCTSEGLEWVDRPNVTLLNLEDTVCDRPPHQNKRKPILQTIHLIKKVRSECRVNCSCAIDYIWEQDKVIYSKTAVNCSGRNFIDFPDPDDLPSNIHTLYLNNNQIQSIEKFAQDERYGDLGVKNLYLDSNQISTINPLESTDWIYNFQVLSLRNNNLTEVPIYMLENIIRENKWLYLIDLSLNDWKCDCRTVSTFKVWLLQHANFVSHMEDVRCERNKDQVRYLRNEDWCKRDEVSQMVELLDLLSIFLALLIILVITKVLYDYWNFKKYGKVPWLVSKM